jgi:hypothetical protein
MMLVPVIVEDAVPHMHTPRPVVVAEDPHRPATPKPRARPYSWAAGLWNRFPARVERDALCIAHHESWNQGLWRARYPNPRVSTASAFAQWTNPTWRAQTRRAHIGTQYRRAMDAPPAVQAAVFAFQDLHYGLYPWAGTGCPGT